MKLIEPTIEYAEQLRAYRTEMLSNESSMDGCGPLRRFEDIANFLKQVELDKHLETCEEGKVPATLFIYVCEDDGKIVGMLQIRHDDSVEFVRKYAGHIGYSVVPSERRKGYAKAMLNAALPEAKKLGLQRVCISCRPENEGSRRTILANGGVYESTVYWPERDVRLERYWIDLE